MKKYTDSLIKCDSCKRSNNFNVSIALKEDQYYYITTCPKCGHCDEVKKLTVKEADLLRITDEPSWRSQ